MYADKKTVGLKSREVYEKNNTFFDKTLVNYGILVYNVL